jgi:lipopolysaccharide heptosyltransferase II
MGFVIYILARLVWMVLGCLPLRLVIVLGRTFGMLGWYCLPSYRRLVHRNLQIAFGSDLDARQRARIGREHFARLAANFAAGACLSGMDVDRLHELVDIEGGGALSTQGAGAGGTVVLLGHLGNWELLARLSLRLFGRPCGTVFQRLTNPHVDAWVRRQRQTDGLLLFERKEGFHGAMDLLRKGGVVGVLCDQHAGDGGLWCPLFGRLASTTPLVATMALRTGSAIVSLVLRTGPLGRWRLVAEPIPVPAQSDIVGLTCLLNRKLEDLIRADPSDWLWSHNRWKTPRPRFLAIGAKRGIQAQAVRQPFRLMVRSVNWLGDAVMMAPAVRAMRRGRPDLELTVVCQPKLAGFWRTVSAVDRVVELPRDGGILAASRVIREENFDAAVLFPQSFRVGLEAWLAGVPVRAGYGGHLRRWLLNLVCSRPVSAAQGSDSRHQVHYYLNLAYHLGAPALAPADWVEASAKPEGRVPDGPWRVAVCPGAEYGPAKRWLPERFAEVIRTVSRGQPVEWTLVGVAKDAPVGAVIEAAVEGVPGVSLRNLIGQTSLGGLVEVLRESEVLLTNDTGTMHLAASLGVRVVAVFGSTDPALTGPLGVGHRVLQHRVPCGPCFRRQCHLDFACMLGVASEEAVQALEALFDSERSGEKGSPVIPL